jgi:hypothetical protein
VAQGATSLYRVSAAKKRSLSQPQAQMKVMVKAEKEQDRLLVHRLDLFNEGLDKVSCIT